MLLDFVGFVLCRLSEIFQNIFNTVLSPRLDSAHRPVVILLLDSIIFSIFSQELSQLRYRLCPGHLKEQQFWRIYFMLVKSYVAE